MTDADADAPPPTCPPELPQDANSGQHPPPHGRTIIDILALLDLPSECESEDNQAVAPLPSPAPAASRKRPLPQSPTYTGSPPLHAAPPHLPLPFTPRAAFPTPLPRPAPLPFHCVQSAPPARPLPSAPPSRSAPLSAPPKFPRLLTSQATSSHQPQSYTYTAPSPRLSPSQQAQLAHRSAPQPAPTPSPAPALAAPAASQAASPAAQPHSVPLAGPPLPPTKGRGPRKRKRSSLAVAPGHQRR